jgi:hypothetical protein
VDFVKTSVARQRGFRSPAAGWGSCSHRCQYQLSHCQLPLALHKCVVAVPGRYRQALKCRLSFGPIGVCANFSLAMGRCAAKDLVAGRALAMAQLLVPTALAR